MFISGDLSGIEQFEIWRRQTTELLDQPQESNQRARVLGVDIPMYCLRAVWCSL